MTPAEALRRYHAAEMRLAEVEVLIEQHRAFNEWRCRPLAERLARRLSPLGDSDAMPVPPGDLASLYLERDRLQAESFQVFTEARREA